MGLVLSCAHCGFYFPLRRTVFLGLTLPQIAAAGVLPTFWLQQTRFFLMGTQRARAGNGRSPPFMFLGMALLGFLEQRHKGITEGRLGGGIRAGRRADSSLHCLQSGLDRSEF